MWRVSFIQTHQWHQKVLAPPTGEARGCQQWRHLSGLQTTKFRRERPRLDSLWLISVLEAQTELEDCAVGTVGVVLLVLLHHHGRWLLVSTSFSVVVVGGLLCSKLWYARSTHKNLVWIQTVSFVVCSDRVFSYVDILYSLPQNSYVWFYVTGRNSWHNFCAEDSYKTC